VGPTRKVDFKYIFTFFLRQDLKPTITFFGTEGVDINTIFYKFDKILESLTKDRRRR
jgi:hypothetical protein